MGKISISKMNITELEVDAIVNAANEKLRPSSGVCGGIYKEANPEKLLAVCESIGHCDVGSAVVTPAFELEASYIIHAVGPRWCGGNHNEGELLYSAYRKSLRLAARMGCESIGFPLLSAGQGGYPVAKAWRIAFQACYDFWEEDGDIDILFAEKKIDVFNIGVKLFDEYFHTPGAAKKDDWKTEAMPDRTETFILQRTITQEQMDILRLGNIPKTMDDKWFWYMEGSTLFAHRSWTGFCIYEITFGTDGHHFVKVNRDPKQYKCTNIGEDRETLNMLLDWWTKPKYDYYNEWLMETYNSMKKSGLISENEDDEEV